MSNFALRHARRVTSVLSTNKGWAMLTSRRPGASRRHSSFLGAPTVWGPAATVCSTLGELEQADRAMNRVVARNAHAPKRGAGQVGTVYRRQSGPERGRPWSFCRPPSVGSRMW